ncbi:hypothetical protein BTR14_05050 [Rhizobium rhizosphaerae]|uniref:DUF4160 domain-containing protein n=1 Tax=Xaviernesmea rhizosphaerae TaxID=1672749 RepID=A0ABX3PFW3_9HYPH|nr:DUF4160 domain-containing protein [Xaviernesmea rhizosphaerae]OQP87313.1 hypothetical protein BTR14_05050 [Xaviernesmea rhizosphaerae]
MPTVLTLAGLRVVIYPNDHRPAHVHLIGSDAHAVFIMNCPDGPAQLRESFGFAKPALTRLARTLDEHRAELCAAWRRIHGDF